MASPTRLRRAVASLLVALALGSVGAACSDDDDTTGTTVEDDGSGAVEPSDDMTGTDDTTSPGQPNSGESDGGENEPTPDVEG